MQRNLERRLRALEISWYGGPNLAAYYRISDEELNRKIETLIGMDGVHFQDPQLAQLSDDEWRLFKKQNARRKTIAELGWPESDDPKELLSHIRKLLDENQLASAAQVQRPQPISRGKQPLE
jgi:DnaJ-domain-containing protein 1